MCARNWGRGGGWDDVVANVGALDLAGFGVVCKGGEEGGITEDFLDSEPLELEIGWLL